jgi:hypothetical protein
MAYVKTPVFCLAFLCLWWMDSRAQTAAGAYTQTPTDTLKGIVIPANDLNRLDKEYAGLSRSIQAQSISVLQHAQQREAQLQRKLAAKDSAAAQTLFAGVSTSYLSLQSKLLAASGSTGASTPKQYLPGVDSIQTALKFLSKYGGASFSPTQLQSLQSLGGQLSNLQHQLQQASNISAFLAQRQQQLQTQLQSFGLGKQLAAFKQQAYYYQAQVQHYKDMLHDPDKMADKVLATVSGLPSFQHYMQNNSQLSTLFRVPGSTVAASGKGINGLQTRAQVSALVAQRLGKGASFPTAVTDGNNGGGNPLGSSMQQAQDQLNNWKTKLGQYGSGSSSTPMPDFQPDMTHNKTFWRRLEAGFNIQSTSSTLFIPAYSSIALILGYKINDKSIVGIGAGYLLGWGQPFNHIALTSQGASVRSFINWKLKGSIWLSGGFEANYLNAFAHFAQLRNINAWQPSGLIGLMKQYKVAKRSGNIQLLYDLLHAEHIPQSQPFIFRVGYSLF